ncbi:AI-2E family transporter [Trinickia sp. LjRoot230]|uniref:AI-2E family transporter n=1 Tax=Trinickia sp. LjRoot230 TaxID=3342288 RepID=UPI003ECCC97A
MVKRNEAPQDLPVREPSPRPVRLTSDMSLPRLSAVEIGSYLAALVGMWAVLHLRLLAALLAGMLIYQLVHMIAPVVERHMSSQRARWLVVVILAGVLVGGLTSLAIAMIEHFEHTVPNIQNLLGQVMQIVEQARTRTPDWISAMLPIDAAQMKEKAGSLVHSHMAQLQQGGKNVARGFGHVLFGMIIGAMVAITVERHVQRLPLSRAFATRVGRFADAFRRIVFAQIKISAINAVFTALYLLIALPLFHQRLPLSKTLVMVTFLVGLLPVVGNLISNTLIVAVSLSVSLPTALASLCFLVAIHKLEYFLNARIVGGQIEARAWELLLAMLIMEAAFGIPGLVAAPIFYAYVKRELIYLRLI